MPKCSYHNDQSEYCRHESEFKMVMHNFQRKMYAVLLNWQAILLYCTCAPMISKVKLSMGLWYFED